MNMNALAVIRYGMEHTMMTNRYQQVPNGMLKMKYFLFICPLKLFSIPIKILKALLYTEQNETDFNRKILIKTYFLNGGITALYNVKDVAVRFSEVTARVTRALILRDKLIRNRFRF